jgi:Tfp pilus assembly protein PilO
MNVPPVVKSLFVVFVIPLLLLQGCGGSKIEELQAENAKLKATIAKQQETIASTLPDEILKADLDSVRAEYQELETQLMEAKQEIDRLNRLLDDATPIKE